MVVKAGTVESFRRLTDPAVQGGAAGGGNPVVERGPHESVHEAIAGRVSWRLCHQSGGHRRVEGTQDGDFGIARGPHEQAQLEGVARHGGEGEDVTGLFGHVDQAPGDHLADVVGNTHVDDGLYGDPPTRPPDDGAGFTQVAQHLA
ncbi:MAG: hypothetical protein ACRD0S_13630, partial [Acidimicrobiales bacterium]